MFWSTRNMQLFFLYYFVVEQKKISHYDGTLGANILGVELEHSGFVFFFFPFNLYVSSWSCGDTHPMWEGKIVSVSSSFIVLSFYLSLSLFLSIYIYVCAPRCKVSYLEIKKRSSNELTLVPWPVFF